MALVKSTLKADIQSMLEKDADSANDFATDLFDAYESYASDGMDISTDTASGFPTKSAAVPILSAAMAGVNVQGITNSVAATQLGNALGSALVVFWTGVIFKTATPFAPMISEILAIVSIPGIPTAAVIATLEPTEDLSVAASVWADAMDTFTKTVQVTITGMMAGPTGPIPAPSITAPMT